MKIVKQISIFFGICLFAEGISRVLPISFPGSLLALLILTILLVTQLLKEEQIKETADFMLGCMGMFFVPAVTGIFEDLAILQGAIVEIVVIVVLSMILTFCCTYGVVSGIRKIQERNRKK